MQIGVLIGKFFFLKSFIKSKDFLPIFADASKYEAVSSFNFIQINCSNKETCEHFKVNKYPTIKVYIQGESLDDEPNRELEPLLEYLEKLSSNPIINLEDNQEAIKDFRANYGDVNFLVVLEKKNLENSQFYQCLENLANNKYKPIFYFGILEKNFYNYPQFKNIEKENLPDIITVRYKILFINFFLV